jgi:hypothetical protein
MTRFSDDSLDEFRRLYPGLTGEDLGDATDRLTRYLDVARRIALRLEFDPDARERFRALTRAHARRYDKGEQSDPSSSPSSP